MASLSCSRRASQLCAEQRDVRLTFHDIVASLADWRHGCV
jgi:hypothetical protein